ncbi:MAG: hypothetical protein WA063_03435 [Minisyncoccia bacterium]
MKNMFNFLKKLSSNSGYDSSPVDSIGASSQVPVDPALKIPKDLEDFLRRREELEYDKFQCEAGQVKLTKLEDLRLENLRINTKKVPRISEEEDPNKNKSGAYTIPAVSLISDCEDYDPEFILLWLPKEQMFGALSGEYSNELIVFPNATWNDIVNDPVEYINAQWKGDYSAAEDFNPWQKYPFG